MGLVLWSIAGCTREPARLVVDPSEVDLPYSEEESKGARQVQVFLRNLGGVPLEITDIDPDCTCTVAAPLEKSLLGPGEETSLRLTVSAPAFGEATPVVTIRSNAAASPAVELTIHVHGRKQALPAIQSATHRLELIGRKPHAAVSGEVEVVTREESGTSPWLRGLESSSSEVFAAQLEDPIEASLGGFVQRTYRFLVQGSCPARGQSVVALCPIVTADETVVRDRVTNVVLRCEPMIRSIPDQLEFPENVTELRFAVISDDESAFELLSIECPAGVTVSRTESESATRGVHVLNAHLDTARMGIGRSMESAVISIQTSRTECPTVAVPIRFPVSSPNDD